jgi:hypothetical protein
MKDKDGERRTTERTMIMRGALGIEGRIVQTEPWFNFCGIEFDKGGGCAAQNSK